MGGLASHIRPIVIVLFVVIFSSSCSEEPIKSVRFDKRGVYAGTFSKYRSYALLSSIEKNINLWDIDKEELIHSFRHKNATETEIRHVALSDPGHIAVTISGDEIAVWDTKTGKSKGYWKAKGFVNAFSMAGDGRFALIAYYNMPAQLLDLETGLVVRELEVTSEINVCTLSLDATKAVFGSESGLLEYWDIDKEKLLYQWREENRVSFVKMSPQGNYIITSSSFRNPKIWRADGQEVFLKFIIYDNWLSKYSQPLLNVISATFSQDENILYMGCPPKNVHVWNLKDMKKLREFNIPNYSFWKPVSSMVYDIRVNPFTHDIETLSSSGYFHSFSKN